MARLLICFTLFIATIGVFADAGQMSKSAPPPGPDCSSVIYNMLDCVDFTSVGSNVTIPSKTCCAGVKSVIAVSPDCLCVGMATAKSMGFSVDDARAKVLPGACKIPATSYHDCGSSPSPSPAPVNPRPSPTPPTKPPSPPSPPSSPTPASPSGGGGAATEAPTPAPAKKSGAQSIGASCLGLFMGLALSTNFVLA